MVYRVYIVKEVTLDADSWEEAKEKAMDDDPDYIMIDEYLDDERNGEEDG